MELNKDNVEEKLNNELISLLDVSSILTSSCSNKIISMSILEIDESVEKTIWEKNYDK